MANNRNRRADELRRREEGVARAEAGLSPRPRGRPVGWKKKVHHKTAAKLEREAESQARKDSLETSDEPAEERPKKRRRRTKSVPPAEGRRTSCRDRQPPSNYIAEPSRHPGHVSSGYKGSITRILNNAAKEKESRDRLVNVHKKAATHYKQKALEAIDELKVLKAAKQELVTEEEKETESTSHSPYGTRRDV